MPLHHGGQIVDSELGLHRQRRDTDDLRRFRTDHRGAEHLAQLGNPTWYARFAAQALTDPAYHKIVIKDALASPSLKTVELPARR